MRARPGPLVDGDGFGPVRAMADAILYEGYLLYPYRRRCRRGPVRWQFGVLTPRAWTRARGPADTSVAGSAEAWWQQTECLLEAGDATVVDCRLRFLQLQRKSVEERGRDGTYRPAGDLDTGTRLEVGFDEAVPHEFDLRFAAAGRNRNVELTVPGGEDVEEVDDDGRPVGRVLRRRRALSVVVRAAFARCPEDGLARLRIRVENTDRTTAADAPRDDALRRSPLACHVLLAVRDGAFVSLLDPPPAARDAARSCRNEHTFPVLAGDDGHRGLVLSSPVLLYDHPRVALDACDPVPAQRQEWTDA